MFLYPSTMIRILFHLQKLNSIWTLVDLPVTKKKHDPITEVYGTRWLTTMVIVSPQVLGLPTPSIKVLFIACKWGSLWRRMLLNNDSGFHKHPGWWKSWYWGEIFDSKHKAYGKMPDLVAKSQKAIQMSQQVHTFPCFFVKTNAARKGLGANAGRAQLLSWDGSFGGFLNWDSWWKRS